MNKPRPPTWLQVYIVISNIQFHVDKIGRFWTVIMLLRNIIIGRIKLKMFSFVYFVEPEEWWVRDIKNTWNQFLLLISHGILCFIVYL